MIQELVALCEHLRQSKLRGAYAHDALDMVPVSIDCVIDQKGKFKQFIPHEPQLTMAEAITAKKGKARLLVDRSEEVLNFGIKTKAKHHLFLEKLEEYSQMPVLSPVVAFYGTTKAEGINKARVAFSRQVEDTLRGGNVAFVIAGKSNRLNEEPEIRRAIISKYEGAQGKLKNARFPRCSVCGSSKHSIVDIPHGMIKRVPDGQTSGCALVSYNDSAFESYSLEGNENSAICTYCARAYVDALNWLLRPTAWKPGGKKGKDIPIFKNRRDISGDTAIVFWLRDSIDVEELEQLDEPDEGKVRDMIDAVFSGRETAVRRLAPEQFFAITLSGTAARIAVRDWIQTSISALRADLGKWFRDIEIGAYDIESRSLQKHFPRFSSLVWSLKSRTGKGVQHGRIGATLWNCAVTGLSPPLWLLSVIMNRVRAEQGRTNSDRIALLKLCLNRITTQVGGFAYMPTLDDSNGNIGYICGRLFAILESIQYHASGGNLNAGIRERFFSFASTMPSAAFGRLMKLSQHHLAKIRVEKPGLAVNLDKKIQKLMCNVGGSSFPTVLSLEEQASFAIGYYHQRQDDFTTKSESKEN